MSVYPFTCISLNDTIIICQNLILLGDVGGQRTLRPYWRNYFEQTDALVWVVDSSDRLRMGDCKHELHSLLTEDVSRNVYFMFNIKNYVPFQRLAGASLLVFANKEDLPGSMTDP